MTTNLASATFTITGAATYMGGGTSFAQTNAPAGTYTITFDDVAGYATPPPQTQMLTAGGSITFSALYDRLILTVTPTSVSVFPSPGKGAPASTTTLTVECHAVGGTNRNCEYSLALIGPTGQDETGGHNLSHYGDRPLGGLTIGDAPALYVQGHTTPDSTVTYVVPEVAGTVRFVATCREPHCSASPPAKIDVQVPDLVDVRDAGNASMTIVPDSVHGSVNSWATHYTRNGLSQVATGFFEQTGKKLRITDIGLPWGGLFDINKPEGHLGGGWRTPHSNHRYGTDVDIAIKDAGASSSWPQPILATLAALIRTKFDFLVRDESPDSDANHWHASSKARRVGAFARADVSCPPGANQLTATVIPSYTVDSASGLYLYQYLVRNGASSKQALTSLQIEAIGPVSSAAAPFGWSVVTAATSFGTRVLFYAAGSPASSSTDGDVAPSPFQLPPGGSLDGFLLRSASSPGTVTYRVIGYASIPSAPSEEEAEALADECADAWAPVSDGTLGPASHLPAPFADEPLSVGSNIIRAVHITALRARIDALRTRFTLAPFRWTDPTVSAGATGIRAQHLLDLRAALLDVYAAAGLPAPAFGDPILAGVSIMASHIAELRAAVIAIE